MSPSTSASSDEETSIQKESQFDDDSSVFEYPQTFRSKSRRTTNTGPKGVRADARAYEASKREANALKSLKNVGLLSVPPSSSLGESGSDASEDEWMCRWREKRMKELSKTGVTGVNLFGQVDDVDARGYLAAVDYQDLDTSDDNPCAAKRNYSKGNVVTIVLIYNNVSSFLVDADDSLLSRQLYSKSSRNSHDNIRPCTFCDYHHSTPRTWQTLHSLPFLLTVVGNLSQTSYISSMNYHHDRQ